MKILISPSKTKNIMEENILNEENNIFRETIEEIVEIMKNKSFEDYLKIYKKEDLANRYYKFYNSYEEQKSYKAIFTYSGQVFKNLDIKSILEYEKYIDDNLYILSALYGILRPFDGIKDYRLDYADNISEKKYIDKINEFLEKEDLIINLASNEYSKNIKHENMYTIEFYKKNKQGKYVKQSTDSKTKRGLFLRYMIENNIYKVEDIKKINIKNTVFREEENKVLKFFEE